jgi:type 1 glutamine amidotransferase
MTRRSLFAAAIALFAAGSLAHAAESKNVLFLTKSSGFQHPVITRDKNDATKLAHAERVLAEFAGANGFTVTVTKDADVFNDPETYKKYDVFAFYTTGDLTKDSNKPGHTEKGMSKEGKEMLLKAIQDGKGVIGFHCASDTFHKGPVSEMLRPANEKYEVDPFIQMIGGEFKGHGSLQTATMKVASNSFPGLEELKDFDMHEEWYNLYNLAPDMHVILIQDTNSMPLGKDGKREKHYQRAPYPATWAKKFGNGRVFYTSMGHKPEVWNDPTFQKVVIAGLNWAAGNTKFEPSPNIQQVSPQPTASAAK